MKTTLFLLLLFLFKYSNTVCLAQDSLKDHLNNRDYGGLEKVVADRYIRMLTTRNAFDYYIYQGKPKGIQYEMAKHFTDHLNKKYSTEKKQPSIVFEMIPVEYDQLIPMLLQGKGDIIAAGLSVTPNRRKRLSFTMPYRIADEVIVTRKENELMPRQEKTFSVRKSSSYFESLRKYKQSLDINIVDESLHTENIMELVSLGKYDYTLVDSYIAEIGTKTFEHLIVLPEKAFGKDINISWAVRKEDVELLEELNAFFPKIKKGSLLGNIISKKYFSNMSRIKSKDFNLEKSSLSKYDRQIKKYSKQYDFDWRLISALCYKESRFKQDIVNRWGAIGLFQIKQKTANEPYINIPNIKGIQNAENNIHAGIKYLAWIKQRYFDPISDMDENAKLRMTLAAYNAGPARVRKAMKQATKLGLRSNEWFRHVELAMLNLGYKEPVNYVSEINKLYVSYLLLGIK